MMSDYSSILHFFTHKLQLSNGDGINFLLNGSDELFIEFGVGLVHLYRHATFCISEIQAK